MAVKDNQLQTVDLNQIQQIGNYGIEEVMAMKDTLGKDLSIPQFNLFVHDSVRLGLEPRLKHSFPILYGGKMDFRISFEGYHAMAQRSEGYIGLKMEVVTENEVDEFYAETDDEGDITNVHHKIKFPRGKVVGSYAIAKREGKKNLIVFCDKPEFEKYAKKNGQFWLLDDKSLDPDMCRKHVGTRAIKGQFAVAAVADESTEAMFGSSDAVQPVERKDITPEVTQTPKQTIKQPANEPTKPIDITPDPAQQGEQEDPRKALSKQLKIKLDALSIPSNKDGAVARDAYYKAIGFSFFDPTNPEASEIQDLLKLLDMKIAEKAAEDDKPL